MTQTLTKLLIASAGVTASTAVLLAVLALLGVAAAGPVFNLLLATSVLLAGPALLGVRHAQAQAAGVQAVNTAFKLGVDYGMARRSRAPVRLDDAA